MTDKKTVIQALAYGFGNGVCKDTEFRFADMPEPYNVQKLMGDALELLIAKEPHVLTLEEACGRDYCFYEYRAAGYIEPASVVMSGLLLNDSEPLVEVFRIGREGPAYVAMKDYGHEWRCWDRMPEDGQKEEVKWNE